MANLECFINNLFFYQRLQDKTMRSYCRSEAIIIQLPKHVCVLIYIPYKYCNLCIFLILYIHELIHYNDIAFILIHSVSPNVTSITQNPAHVYENDSVSLSCNLSQPCVPACSFYWYKSGSRKHESNLSTLAIERPSRQHSGFYWCVASNVNNESRAYHELTVMCKFMFSI